MVIVDQFYRQGPAINVGSGALAKTKNQLPHLATSGGGFVAVTGQCG
jgi:hypothetical protein